MPKTDHSFNLDGYATVAERITLFYERHPAGRIQTELVSRADGEITFKALVFRELADGVPAATGWASERVGDGDINTVACLENTETSAIGRALANLGFTASTKRPSREEMEKADRTRRRLTREEGMAYGSPGPEQSRNAPVNRMPRGEVLQEHADAAHDLLDLIAAAERRGFPVRRAEVIRERAARVPPLPMRRIRKLERMTRAWMRRHM